MKQKILILLLATCSFLSLNAQKEQNNWFFGEGAGLTWNKTATMAATGVFGTGNATLSGLPTSLGVTPINTYEGCFSLSDVDGNLLFFSDGMTIWDKNMNPMVNGGELTGNSSSAQSGIIIPYPSSSSRYIAVTLGERMANNLSYSIVNMSLGGGLGAVEAANKNVLLTSHKGLLGETVTAVRHSNRDDFWIVALGRPEAGTTTSYLNVWKVSSTTGVQTSCHSTFTIPNAGGTADAANGYIKFTSDGKHFVTSNFGSRYFLFGDFDPSTGKVLNVKIRANAYFPTAIRGGAYGVEFSPNGKYLYLTQTPTGISGTVEMGTGLFIYDLDALLSAADPNTIFPIKTLQNPTSLANGLNDHFGGIQRAPDNRIYITNFNSAGMFIIDNPDEPLNLKVYKIAKLFNGKASFGLPSFAAPWFKMHITPPADTQACSEATESYSLSFENGMGFNLVSRIVLDFGDGGNNSQVTINNPNITATYTRSYYYKAPGTYTITATAYNSSGGVEITQTSTMIIRSCVLKVNKHIRGVNQ